MGRIKNNTQMHKLQSFHHLGLIWAIIAFLGLPALGRAQSYPPAWNTTAHYAIGDQVQENGNIYRAIRAVTSTGVDPAKYYTYWELYDVRANTTLFIGSQETFPTFLLAWNYAVNCRISPAVYLHFYISTFHANLTETFAGPFSLDHPFGANISILGDFAPNILFNFSNASGNGFAIDSGHSIAAMLNFTVQGGQGVIDGYAIAADGNATFGSIGSVTMNNFNGGILAQHGAVVHCANNLIFQQIDGPFSALYNGIIMVDPGFTYTSTTPALVFYADFGGQIIAETCDVENTYFGARANHAGIIDVNGCRMKSLSLHALIADQGARIYAENAILSSNPSDITVSDGGTVDVIGAIYTNVSSDNQNGSYIIVS
jgi:hypothetical protein